MTGAGSEALPRHPLKAGKAYYLHVSEGLIVTPWDYTLGKRPRMVQNNTVSPGNVPKWGQYPVGVFLGCDTKPLGIMQPGWHGRFDQDVRFAPL